MTEEEIYIGAERMDLDELLEAVRSQMFGMENPGFCLVCGAEHQSCEPDAREDPCDECGENAVFGASEILIYVAP